MSDRSPTLDQLRVFVAVVEAGSFSRAAEVLGRAQSVVSYTIGNLESLLGCALFERGRRRPMLTEAGRAMLADARRIDLLTREMAARAAGLTGGLEGEVSLAVDVMYPSVKLVSVLQAFAAQFPTVALDLQMEALGGVLKLVLDGESGLGLSGPRESWPDPIEAVAAGAARLEAVAAPSHPLAQYQGAIPVAALREHTQLVLSDRSRMTEGHNFGVYAAQTWRLGDLDAKHRLLLAGLGWGSMPEHIVEPDIASGALVRLTLADRDQLIYPFALIRRVDSRTGPAMQWLIERFAVQRAD
ncbi:LysR family transcriptional regulator [Crenobacter sp. SG2303]|uniref:LysR family transcriptional regulator n=1 Tax=Crenobacter oryzisoli TaxID=3056844 RepID=A0ABT7XR83_9NEIS|nr:LysR family transcriptional regulator [Crenobacter sp. SG2303]MDN0076208.1 LysR family transcriptional regulator [Crenobacter sp. SG2303]